MINWIKDIILAILDFLTDLLTSNDEIDEKAKVRREKIKAIDIEIEKEYTQVEDSVKRWKKNE